MSKWILLTMALLSFLLTDERSVFHLFTFM